MPNSPAGHAFRAACTDFRSARARLRSSLERTDSTEARTTDILRVRTDLVAYLNAESNWAAKLEAFVLRSPAPEPPRSSASTPS